MKTCCELVKSQTFYKIKRDGFKYWPRSLRLSKQSPAQNGDWQVKIEAICDMPTTNQGDYGMLHVTLMSKDGRKLLIDENFSVDMDLMEDGKVEKI